MLPNEIVTEIILHSSPCYLKTLITTNRSINSILTNNNYLREIAINNGLPFASSLKMLCDFEQIPVNELLKLSAMNNDIRIVESSLQKGGEITKGYEVYDIMSYSNEDVSLLLSKNGQLERNKTAAMLKSLDKDYTLVVKSLLDDYDNSIHYYKEYIIGAAYRHKKDILSLILDYAVRDYDTKHYKLFYTRIIDELRDNLEDTMADYIEEYIQ